MSAITNDDKGFIIPCANCGQKNRTPFARLAETGTCGKCHQPLPPPGQPFDIGSAAEFDRIVAESALPMVVDFWAAWCGPCRMVAPEMIKVAEAGRGEFSGGQGGHRSGSRAQRALRSALHSDDGGLLQRAGGGPNGGGATGGGHPRFHAAGARQIGASCPRLRAFSAILPVRAGGAIRAALKRAPPASKTTRRGTGFALRRRKAAPRHSAGGSLSFLSRSPFFPFFLRDAKGNGHLPVTQRAEVFRENFRAGL